jgi:hypothetical protein
MKLIPIGHGVVLSNAIAAVLHSASNPEEQMNAPATILLNSGSHLATGRAYGDVVADLQAAMESKSLTELMPDVLAGMDMIRQHITDGTISVTVSSTPELAPIAKPSKKT